MLWSRVLLQDHATDALFDTCLSPCGQRDWSSLASCYQISMKIFQFFFRSDLFLGNFWTACVDWIRCVYFFDRALVRHLFRSRASVFYSGRFSWIKREVTVNSKFCVIYTIRNCCHSVLALRETGQRPLCLSYLRGNNLFIHFRNSAHHLT